MESVFPPEKNRAQTAPFETWADFAGHLENLGLFRMNPGTARLAGLLDKLGRRRSSMPLAQVVGTNGKGSTCTFLASLARAHGLSCILHSSPHFVCVRERVRLFRPGGRREGELLPEAAWLEAANTALAAGGAELTYFELITLLAVILLEREKADLAVMESGLGGTFDATTALEADLVLFAPIARDHLDVLGRSLAEIAADKAGALRPGGAAISSGQEKEAADILRREARLKASSLSFVRKEPEPDSGKIRLGLEGEYQKENAALALAAWKFLAPLCRTRSRREAETEGLGAAWIPGRLQRIVPAPDKDLPGLILDGGHNPHALAALGQSLARLGIAPAAVIFNCMQDKEPEKLVPHLRILSAGPVFVPGLPGNSRAMSPEILAGLIGLSAVPAKDLRAALDLAGAHCRERLPEAAYRRIPESGNGKEPWRPLLICGSLYLLGEFFALYPQYLLAPEPEKENSYE
ncbi:MAG: bifunctional folylpolyglutamate synthase/dihydrofolate synthase [Deltaproteobacteria bacterium]|nr:bifunctional folylpolyglutamate synthase/dihydrofolate synthase [Deltaproteobacteria bacterium]